MVPGSPFRNDDVMYRVIQNARLSSQPFLGTCAGLQDDVVEFARNVAGIANAGHADSAPDAGDLVIDCLACSLVGRNVS